MNEIYEVDVEKLSTYFKTDLLPICLGTLDAI